MERDLQFISYKYKTSLMAYYQDSEDPYGSYDPEAPLDPYATEEEESFEFYDEGSDPYGEDGLYLSDGVDEFPEDGLEYDEYDDELYEEEGDGMMYDDDLLFQDDWLPLPPEEIPIETLPFEERPEDYGSQLLIGGLQHPDPASMRDSYCQFYPEACLEGAGLSGREPFNRTEVAEELDRTLKDIDMTGLAIAAVLILILLFGLHYGGATETPAAPTPSSAKDKIRSRLKAAGYVDPELAKRVDEVMKLAEDKREPEMDRLFKKQYGQRLKDAGVKEPKLAEDLAAIMKLPEKDREAKFKELTGTGPVVESAEDAADRKKYNKKLSDGGIRSPERAKQLDEVMALPADQREAKCDAIIAESKSGAAVADPEKAEKEKYKGLLKEAGFEGETLGRRLKRIMDKPAADRDAELKLIIAEKAAPVPVAVDPERASYKQRLENHKITEPELTKMLDEIMAQPTTADRDAKYKELTKPPSTSAASDADAADRVRYGKLLKDSGIKDEARLARKLNEVMKLPAAEREDKCNAIIAAEKAASTPDAKKPMTAEQLDAELKKYISDDAQRAAAVASLAKKSLADQTTEIEKIKKKKEDREKQVKEKEAAKTALTTKLQDAGVKDPKTLDKEVRRLTPMSPADQATEIGKIKAAFEAQKAAAAEKEAKEKLRAALDTELKEAGYTNDKDRQSRVERLMGLEGAARDSKKKDYIDALKNVGKGNPSDESTAATNAAQEEARKAAQATLRAELEAALKEAGYTDQTRIDEMLNTLMGMPDKKKRDLKLENYKGRAPKTNSPSAETPEQKTARKAAEDAATRADLDKRLLDAKYTDKTDRDAKVDSLMRETDPAEREKKLKRYLGRKPGSPGGPPAIDGTVPGNNSPDAPSSPPLSDADFKKKLVELGYTAPAVANMMKSYSGATPEQKKKLSDTLLTNDVTKQKANEDKYKGKGEPGAPKAPKTPEEFKEALVSAGYKEPALGEMMKAYNAAGTDEAKKALSDKLLTNSGTQIRANQKEYAAKAAGNNPGGDGIMAKTDLDAKLKGLGYGDAARKRMLDHWEKTTDPKEKKTLQDKMLSDANKAAYTTRYADGGQVPLVKGEKDSLDKLLKNRGYDDATRKKMLDAWEKANNVDRDIIYEDITSENPDQIAKNKTQYGPNGTGAPPPTDLTAAAHREAMDKMLSDAGFDDKDAREAILDKVISEGGTPQDQIKNLATNFTKRSDDTRAKLNKEYGDKRRNDAAAGLGPDGKPVVDPPATLTELPSDDEILKALEKAGWSDPDARQYLLSRIKDNKKTPEEQLRSFKGYTKAGAGTDALNKDHGDKWRKAHPAGTGPTADPSKLTTLPNDQQILKDLEAAKWTDPDARKYLLDRIKNKGPDGKVNVPNKPAADQLADYKKYTTTTKGTPDLNAEYGKRWKTAHPADPELTDEEKELDKQLAGHGYSPDTRRRMLSELRDPKNKDKKEQMMKEWMGKNDDEVKAINKKKENEQAAIDVANGARKGVVDPNAKTPKGTPPDPNAKVPKGSTPSGEGGGSSEPWLTGPQLMLLGLLLIPIFLVLSRGMTTPSGQSMLRMPTMPVLPTLRGPWSSPPIMAGGIPVSTGLPELASKRKTKTRKSASSIPRMAVSHEKGASGGSLPAISINNVNAQGRDIPININSGSGGGGSDGILGAVMEEVLTTEETTVEETVMLETAEKLVVEEQAVVVEETPIIAVIEEEEEAITIELQGPSNPNRLFWMIVCLIIIAIPLLFDYSSDGPDRTLSENEYLSAMYHWIVLAIAIFFLFLRLDRAYHWTTRYGRPFVRVTRKLPGMVTPVIVGTVEGTERLIWGVDDAVFGNSQEMLGLVLASAVFLVAAMSDPHDSMDKGEYTEGSWQFMPLLAIAFITFLFHNASASVVYY